MTDLLMTKIGVVGTGTMGTNHVRVLSEMKNVKVSISDVDKTRCKDIADTFNIESYYSDHTEMVKKEKLDGLIVAVPSQFHKKVLLDALECKNILIEKPIAEDLEDAVYMADAAKKKGVNLSVGHIERFNPVVKEIGAMMKQLGDLYMVNTVRAGPFPKRLYGNSGGVLKDLAVHDVDIINHLIGKIEKVYSQIIRSGKQEIHANVMFSIKNITGSSQFSWVSPRRTRTIEIYGTNGMLHGDYHQQELWFYENPDSTDIPRSKNLFKEILLRGNIGEGKIIKYPIKKEEPLKLELQNFIESIENKTQPEVKPQDGIDALKIAISILESGETGKPVRI